VGLTKTIIIIIIIPFPGAVWSKAFVCGRYISGIAGLYPAGGLNIRPLCSLCVV